MKYQLSEGEEFIVNVRRHFLFLYKHSFLMNGFRVHGRDKQVVYAHEKNGMEISFEDEGSLLIYIKRQARGSERAEKDIMFEVSEICREFGDKECPIEL